MYKLGSKWLLVTRDEIKKFKDKVTNRPCNDEIRYYKRISELKDVVRDQDHELYVQKQKISELEKLLKAKQTSTTNETNTKSIRIERGSEYSVCSDYPSREEVTKQIQEEVGSAVEIRNLKDKLAMAKVKYDKLLAEKEETTGRLQRLAKLYEKLISERDKLSEELEEIRSRLKDYHDDIEYSTLKSKYDNLMDENVQLMDKNVQLIDENTQLKRQMKNYELGNTLTDNTEALVEAKLIIDALQKENATLKSQLSDYEAHRCHCDNSNNEEYIMLKEKYDKILRDNVLLIAEEGKRAQDKKDNEEKHNIYRDRMNRVVNESLAKARYFAGLTDYLDDAMDLLSKIGVHTVSHTNVSTDKTTNKYFITLYGTKYQTSMKLHQVTSQFVEKAKSLEKEVSAYRNADLEETMNEDEE